MKVKIRLFDIYIITITFLKGMGLVADSKLYLLACVFGCAVLFMKVFMERFYPKELFGMITIMAIGGLNLAFGGGTSILITAIALCGLKNVNSERIIKISFWSRLTAFLMMFFLSITGAIDNEVVSFWRDGAFVDRITFGYGTPNTAHMMFTISAILMLYLYGERMRILHFALLALSNQLLFIFTGSRTGWLVVWLSMLCYFLITAKKTGSLAFRVFRYAYILLGAITLLLGLSYGRIGFVTTLDTLMTGRIYYINRILLGEPIPIFGRTDYQSILVDNGWIKLLYMGGIFAFAWFSYYIIAIEKKLYRENRRKELFLVTCFLFYNMGESFIDAFSLNVSLVFIGEVLFSRREEEWKNSQYSHLPTIGENN